MSRAQTTEKLLVQLYGEAVARETRDALRSLLEKYRSRIDGQPNARPLSQRDAILITYADQVRSGNEAPLRTLAHFCDTHLAGSVSAVHLLPFYPWSSDDGFSVKDYYAVASENGTWEDVGLFRGKFDLMFDAVFNHLSAQSGWFRHFCDDVPAFRDYFVTVTGEPDLSGVVRPRALPLLTGFDTARGPEKVWTTFSADQVDLNVKNPQVLLALIDALLFYIAHEARFIRLDAIAYLWKEIGTPCIHLPQTHAVIRLFRTMLDQIAPDVQLITETNVPHRDNLSYFGDGHNEAQLVYNFALPPLVLHALLKADATHLSGWAGGLSAPSADTTFFNFLASHDGIGLNPARGILPPEEIDFLVERCQAHGGLISYKNNADGSTSPYEMNIVYFDALNDPAANEPIALAIDRFLVSQAIMLALAGVPGIYFHSLFGSRNDREAARASGINRRINRHKFTRLELESALNTPGSLPARVLKRYRELLQLRAAHAAFDPHATQHVLPIDSRVFALLRGGVDTVPPILCLHNVSAEPVTLQIPLSPAFQTGTWIDQTHPELPPLPSGKTLTITLAPYAVDWLLHTA